MEVLSRRLPRGAEVAGIFTVLYHVNIFFDNYAYATLQDALCRIESSMIVLTANPPRPSQSYKYRKARLGEFQLM